MKPKLSNTYLDKFRIELRIRQIKSTILVSQACKRTVLSSTPGIKSEHLQSFMAVWRNWVILLLLTCKMAWPRHFCHFIGYCTFKLNTGKNNMFFHFMLASPCRLFKSGEVLSNIITPYQFIYWLPIWFWKTLTLTELLI